MAEEYSGTVIEVLKRLQLAYPGVRDGDDINSKQIAADLIVIMKAAGRNKRDFLRNLGELWDDIHMETIQ